MGNKETRVAVQGVGKKYCRDLKRSLWYGVADLAREYACLCRRDAAQLRKAEFWALRDVSFRVAPGECAALIGPNGAGKSTLLKLLGGLIKPDEGRIALSGRVGALIEVGTGFHPVLNGRENVYAAAALLGLTKREVDRRMDEIVEFSEIGDAIEAPVQSYSSGMRVRLGFAVAAHLNPEILLIDEVLAVGDIGFRMKCYKHIHRLLDGGTSIIVVSHGVNHLARVTDRAVLLAGGRCVFDGPLGEGISRYHHLLPPGAKEHRQPHGDAPRIAACRLLDSGGEPASEFQTGETLVAEIRLECRRPLRGARLKVQIESPAAGILGTFGTPHAGFRFELRPPGTRLRLTLPDLPLLVGGYHLNLALAGPDITEKYHRLAPAASFSVVGPKLRPFGFGRGGIFRFRHHWQQIEPGADARCASSSVRSANRAGGEEKLRLRIPSTSQRP